MTLVDDLANAPLRVFQTNIALFRLGLNLAAGVEQEFMRLLRSRLDQAQPQAAQPLGCRATATPETRMVELLDRSLRQSQNQSRQELYRQLINDLTPDEARILAKLAEGKGFPLVHVFQRGRNGHTAEPLLQNACLVGKIANVSLPHMTPLYVTHLLGLGLVEVVSKEAASADDFQILMADDAVLDACKRATRGPVLPRVERHALKLSALGEELWGACNPNEAVRPNSVGRS